MKKYLAILLSLAMLLSLTVTAFATDSSSEGKAWSELTNQERYPLSTDKTFDVVIDGRFTNPNEKYSAKLWKEITGVDINYVPTSAEQLTTQLAAHDFRDAYLMLTTPAKSIVDEYGQAGNFIDFTEYFEYMPNLVRLLEEYPESKSVAYDMDGHMYALPIFSMGPTAQRNVIYIRNDMLAKAGWDKAPETTDEFLQCIKDIQAAYSDDPEFIAFHPFAAQRMEYTGVMGTISAFFFPSFGDLIETAFTADKDGKVVLGAATEQYKRYLAWMNEIWNSGAFDTNIYSEDGTECVAMNAANKTGVCDAKDGWGLSNWDNGKLDVTVISPLTSEYQAEKHWQRLWDAGYRFTSVSSACEDPITMCKWLDSFYAKKDAPFDEEGNIWGISFWQGVEGLDVIVDRENNTYETQPHEGYASTEDWEANATFQMSAISGQWQYHGALTDFNGVKGYGTINNLRPYSVKVSGITTLPLTIDEQDDVNMYWGDLNKYIGEMTAKFITGEENLDAQWDTYLKQLNNMGLEEVTAIWQAAYDRQPK